MTTHCAHGPVSVQRTPITSVVAVVICGLPMVLGIPLLRSASRSHRRAPFAIRLTRWGGSVNTDGRDVRRGGVA